MPKCGAKRRDGQPCQQNALRDSKRCRQHGGRSLRGEAHWNYQHKGRSKYLPAALTDRYLQALNDPDLLATDKDIALLDLRMQELTTKLNASDMGILWQEARAAWRNMERARHAEDDVREALCRTELGSLIERAADTRYLWADIVRCAQDLAQLRVIEHKRLVDLQTMMNEGQVYQLVGLIQRAVYEVVMAHLDAKDGRRILSDIQAKVQQYLPQRTTEPQPTSASERL